MFIYIHTISYYCQLLIATPIGVVVVVIVW
jgi:hypothetical protein